jgi:hypothetical protein
MTSDKVIEALETYSNVVVAFMVVQSIGFSFTFGTKPTFTCLVHTADLLATGLIAHFIVSTVLACIAVAIMSNTIQRVATENIGVMKRIYLAKIIVILLFAMIPITLLFTYSIGYESTFPECVGRFKS